MKKINFTLLVCLLLAGIFASCDDDDKYPVPPEVSIESVNGVFAMPQEDSIVLKAKVESPLPTTLSWSVKGNEVSKDTVFTFKMNELGTYDVKLTATNADGVTSATTSIEVYGKYKYGTFVLNEGYQADPSTLIFISPPSFPRLIYRQQQTVYHFTKKRRRRLSYRCQCRNPEKRSRL